AARVAAPVVERVDRLAGAIKAPAGEHCNDCSTHDDRGEQDEPGSHDATLSALWCSAPGPLGPFPRCSAGYPPRGRSAFAETSSSARRRVDLLGQAVEPSVLLQQEVEVEEVVRHER